MYPKRLPRKIIAAAVFLCPPYLWIIERYLRAKWGAA